MFYCSVWFKKSGEEKRLVKSGSKNVSMRADLILRPKDAEWFIRWPVSLPESRWKESISTSENILWRICLPLKKPKSFFLIAYISPLWYMHFIVTLHKLYRALLPTGRFPIHYITYCIERSAIQTFEELFRATVCQLQVQVQKTTQVHLRTWRDIGLKGLSFGNRASDPAKDEHDLGGRSLHQTFGLFFPFTNIPWILCSSDPQNSKVLTRKPSAICWQRLFFTKHCILKPQLTFW